MDKVTVSVEVPKVAVDLADVLAGLVTAIKQKEPVVQIIGEEISKVIALVSELSQLPEVIKDHSQAVALGLAAKKIEDALAPVTTTTA